MAGSTPNLLTHALYKLYRKSKGKVHPRTGHEGPQGEWIYSSTLSLTSASDGGGRSSHVPAALLP